MSPTYIKQKYIRIKGSFYFKGSKLENQHTRKTLGTLSWVYKLAITYSDRTVAILVGCIGRKTCVQLKPLGVEMHIPPPNVIRSMITLVRQFSLQTQ